MFQKQGSFFSFTKQNGNYTLILDDELVKQMDSDLLLDCDPHWGVIQVDLGQMGYVGYGLIRSVCEPLARKKIPLYYVSTTNNDLILVKNDRLQEAMQCLSTALSEPCGSRDAEFVPQPLPGLKLRKFTQAYLSSFSWAQKDEYMKALIKILFYNQQKDSFFSFTQNDDEISLFIDPQAGKILMKVETEDCINFDKTWGTIIIEFDHNKKKKRELPGVVSSLSRILADQQIPILYLSTFSDSLLLVKKDKWDLACSALGAVYDLST